MNERRAFERIPLHASVAIKRTPQPGSAITGSLIDLSAGGLSLYSQVSLQLGEIVTVQFELPDDQGAISLELDVLASDDQVPGGAFVRGRFYRPRPHAVLRIARWTELQRAALRTRLEDLGLVSRPEFIAYVVTVNGLQLERPLLGGIEDISLAGISLSLNAPIEPGSRLRIAVVFRGEPRPDEMDLEVVATGRWVSDEHIAHCRFLNLPESVRAKIQAWTEADLPDKPR